MDGNDIPYVRRHPVCLVSNPGCHTLERRNHHRHSSASVWCTETPASRKEDQAEHGYNDKQQYPKLAVRVMLASNPAHQFSFLEVITTRFRSSMFSSDLPVPSPTHESGSSAIRTGIPVSLDSNLSRFWSNAPPPVIMIP